MKWEENEITCENKNKNKTEETEKVDQASRQNKYLVWWKVHEKSRTRGRGNTYEYEWKWNRSSKDAKPFGSDIVKYNGV